MSEQVVESAALLRARRELAECLAQLDVKDYYNGGQTVVTRYPRGSEARAGIVAEATFWQGEISRLSQSPTSAP